MTMLEEKKSLYVLKYARLNMRDAQIALSLQSRSW